MRTALLKAGFAAHLEIPFASHLEILCSFRFWSTAGESRRALNVAQLIKIRIEQMTLSARCKVRPLPLMLRAGSTVAEQRRLLRSSTKREVYP
jgi:hypothetical protein